MSNAQNVNTFFSKNVYDHLGEVALSPFLWTIEDSDNGHLLAALMKIAWSPILVPATIATCGLAFALALVAFVTHVGVLIGATLLDMSTASIENVR